MFRFQSQSHFRVPRVVSGGAVTVQSGAVLFDQGVSIVGHDDLFGELDLPHVRLVEDEHEPRAHREQEARHHDHHDEERISLEEITKTEESDVTMRSDWSVFRYKE